MSNPIRESVRFLWEKMRGRYYYPTNDAHRIAQEYLTKEVNRFAYVARLYDSPIIADMVQREKITPHYGYRHFKKVKANGGFRDIHEPDEKLKTIQRNLLRSYLSKQQVHQAAKGFRRHHSIADHVWAHVGARIIITADVQDFFPSTKRWRVYDWWYGELEDEKAATLATLLTTWHGSLPQGAPTSPVLTNIINVPMDTRLYEHVLRSGGIYTRYGDDMVFSWQGNDRPPAQFKQYVTSILREFGYTLHPDKWHEYTAKDEPEITGIVLRKHGVVTVTDDVTQAIKQLQQSGDNHAALSGYLGFQKMIEEHNPR